MKHTAGQKTLPEIQHDPFPPGEKKPFSQYIFSPPLMPPRISLNESPPHPKSGALRATRRRLHGIDKVVRRVMDGLVNKYRPFWVYAAGIRQAASLVLSTGSLSKWKSGTVGGIGGIVS